MTKIALVLPYFGCLPNTFPFFLQSCKDNATVDFIIISDLLDDSFAAENIKIIRMSFLQLKRRIQNLFDFTVCLESPYKLCDYKPLYGHIFEKELSGYGFWGYCDADLVFGNIRKFISEELLSQYDRIFDRGHLSLYRNTDRMRFLYTECENYKKMLQSSEIFVFDESFYSGINKACIDSGITFFRNRDYIFDCSVSKFLFRNVNDEKTVIKVFHYASGSLFSKDSSTEIEAEWLYAHFQKRKFDISKNCTADKFSIVANCYCDLSEVELFLRKQKMHPFYCVRYYKYRILNALKKRYIRLAKTILR